MGNYKDIDNIITMFGEKYIIDAFRNYLSSDEWNDFVENFEREHDLDYYEDTI